MIVHPMERPPTASREQNGQAVFCVCADQELIHAAVTACSMMPGLFFAGAFNDYITAERRPQFSQSMKTASSCIALIDFDKDPEHAVKTAERLSQIFVKRICIIAVARTLESSLLLQAIRSGCMEFLTTPVDLTDLTTAVRRFQQFMSISPQTQTNMGRVLTFFGAKGGVGTTTLAVHLATHLVRQHNRKTLIIDHKHQLGHVALYLGLKDTQYHFDELLRNVDRLDVELFSGYVLRHSSGLDVIPSPEVAPTYYDYKQNELERVMDFLRREYDYIIIDSYVGSKDSRTSLIEQADEIYLVSTPDIASLRDLARLVDHVILTPSTEGKLRITINRSTADDSITTEQIRSAVRFPVSHTIPNNYAELLRAINQGEPVSPSRKSEFNHALSAWSAQMVDARHSNPSKASKGRPARSFAFWR